MKFDLFKQDKENNKKNCNQFYLLTLTAIDYWSFFKSNWMDIREGAESDLDKFMLKEFSLGALELNIYGCRVTEAHF